MESSELTGLQLDEKLRSELFKRAFSLLAETRDSETTLAYLKDVEQRLASGQASADDIPGVDEFMAQTPGVS